MDILIDFDGTCVTHEFPLVGKDIGAAQVLRDLVRNGHRLILFTMRAEDCSIQPALDWFAENDIALYAVQCHPEQHKFTSSPKALGDLMIDDTALGVKLYPCRLSRDCVDWQWAAEELLRRGLLTGEQVARYDFAMRMWL